MIDLGRLGDRRATSCLLSGLVAFALLTACKREPPTNPDVPAATPVPKAEIDANVPDVAAKAVPVGPSPVVQFEIGHYRACAVRADGRVVCWGPGMGTLDPDAGITEAPRLVPGLDDAVQVAGDDWFFCVRRKGGDVSCFEPDMKPKSMGVPAAVEISGSCARHADGRVTCWDGDTTKPHVLAGITARALGGGDGTPCVIDDKGVPLCWGSNNFHQLGDGTTTDRPSPGPIKGLALVDEIQTSLFHDECALAGGAVKCWGGELGKVTTPKTFAGLAHVSHLAIGEYHSCALIEGGTIKCWGSNDAGQLGIAIDEGKDTSSDVPVAVAGVDHVVELRVGGGEPAGGAGSTCVRKSGLPGAAADSLWCWGSINTSSKPVQLDLTIAPP